MKSKLKKIVVIDDEESICLLLSHILEKIEYTTTCAYNLDEGHDLVSREQPGIVFLDINLPDGSGFDLLKKLKNENEEMKVIIVSAYDDEQELKKARMNGADDFISKPFTMQEIKDVVQKMETSLE